MTGTAWRLDLSWSDVGKSSNTGRLYARRMGGRTEIVEGRRSWAADRAAAMCEALLAQHPPGAVFDVECQVTRVEVRTGDIGQILTMTGAAVGESFTVRRGDTSDDPVTVTGPHDVRAFLRRPTP